MGFSYLACPYHHADDRVMEYRAMRATQVAAALIGSGKVVFSPLSHSKEMLNLPRTWDFWQRYDREFLETCEHLYVLCLEDWEKSKGVQEEINVAEMLGIPVTYLNSRGLPCSMDEWAEFLWERSTS